MIDISFEINGKKVSPRNTGDALESAVLQSIKDSITKSVGLVRCPEHGSKPSIQAKGRSLDSLTFEVSGCCSKLIDEVKRKLN